MNKKRLLLVIPTHNRPRKLDRTLRFIAMQQRNNMRKFELHLLDSSDHWQLKDNAKALRLVSNNLDVYHHDFNGYSFLSKYNTFVLNHRSNILCTIGDDDFLNLEAMNDAATFLAQNPDFSSANGRIITGKVVQNGVFDCRVYEQEGSEKETKYERAKDHLFAYHNNFYTVARGACLAKYWGEIDSATVGRSLKERLAAIAPLLCGKRRIQSGVFLVRDKSGKTGYDECGNRTLPDDPDSQSYVSDISFGYEEYENIVLSWINGECEKEEISRLLEQDFEKWKAGKIGRKIERPLLSRMISKCVRSFRKNRFKRTEELEFLSMVNKFCRKGNPPEKKWR